MIIIFTLLYSIIPCFTQPGPTPTALGYKVRNVRPGKALVPIFAQLEEIVAEVRSLGFFEDAALRRVCCIIGTFSRGI